MAVIPLKHPFELAGKRYEALTLRRARTGDLRVLDKSGGLELVSKIKEGEAPPAGVIDAVVPFLARVCDVDEAVFDRLDSEDFFAVFERFEEVMPAGTPLPAGTNSTS